MTDNDLQNILSQPFRAAPAAPKARAPKTATVVRQAVAAIVAGDFSENVILDALNEVTEKAQADLKARVEATEHVLYYVTWRKPVRSRRGGFKAGVYEIGMSHAFAEAEQAEEYCNNAQRLGMKEIVILPSAQPLNSAAAYWDGIPTRDQIAEAGGVIGEEIFTAVDISRA